MVKEKHIHKLRMHKFASGNKTFFCILPDCNYKVKTALALGKRSLCNRCGNSFIMNEYSIRLVKPHCEECHKDRNGRPTRIIEDDEIINQPLESLAERLSKLANQKQEEDEI